MNNTNRIKEIKHIKKMKINPLKTFGNPFDDVKISSNNFGRFADDTKAKLIHNNVNNAYTPLIDALNVKMIPFRAELSQIDTGINIQVGKTATVDGFMVEFKGYMSENYVFIAAALGGEKTEAFGELYPNGKSEYTALTKTKAPTIMARLKTVGDKYATELGVNISAKLQDFQTQWSQLRQNQLDVKSAVKTNRAERSVARREVEIELIKIMHFIGNKYPGDVEQCMVYFDFNLLYAKHKHKKDPNDANQ